MISTHPIESAAFFKASQHKGHYQLPARSLSWPTLSTGAYAAFRSLNITKALFYREHLQDYCDGRVPHMNTSYTHFCKLDHDLPRPETSTSDAAEESFETTTFVEKPVASTVRNIGSNLQLAKLSDLPVDGAAGVRPLFRSVPRVLPKTHKSVFRINLPDGMNLEFETASPEWLAMQMVLALRRAA